MGQPLDEVMSVEQRTGIEPSAERTKVILCAQLVVIVALLVAWSILRRRQTRT